MVLLMWKLSIPNFANSNGTLSMGHADLVLDYPLRILCRLSNTCGGISWRYEEGWQW